MDAPRSARGPKRPATRDVARRVEPSRHQLAAVAPVISPTKATAALPSSAPQDAAPEPGPGGDLPHATGPVTLASDLALICPVRTQPPYPPLSRRLGEAGRVVLRVELDETGRPRAARLIASSGHPRLDDAALAAVWTWRCHPAQRDGQAVRAVAIQPFDFTLQGR
jgi:protein TonB